MSFFNDAMLMLQPTPLGLARFLCTLVASFLIYAWPLQKAKPSMLKFLEKYYPGKSNLRYIWIDLIFNTVIGSAISFAVYNPNGWVPALAAGITWPSVIKNLAQNVGKS